VLPDGESFITSQQPGSPWCPQQLCPLETLIQLFRNSRYTFRCSGMGADILVKKDFMLGIYLLPN